VENENIENMNVIKIFYFSGTGNAKQVASWFSELAIERNIDCQLFDIAKADFKSTDYINSEDFLIIIAPIHGFNFPKIALDFIRRLPNGKNRVVLMNTRGGLRIGRLVTPGLTGIAFMLSSFILRKKGYKIIGQIPFDMPSNWISIHPALSEKSVIIISGKNHERVKKHFEKLYAGKTDFPARKEIVQNILISPVSVAYYFGGKYFFAKSYYASSKCNHCNLCIKECPVNAIKTVNQRPYWTLKCQSCMKCMNICPASAIETTHGLWIVTCYVSAIITPIITVLLPSSVHHWLVTFLIFNVFFWGLIALLYKAQHCLLKNRILAKIILFTSFTYYKFWGRYHCKHVRNLTDKELAKII
jgi:Pyruvate/2-oxoacid:ferredoxin oxidoreductase delta subunit